MIYLSKSKYCGLWQCSKIAWMKKYKPEELSLDGSVVSRMEAGNEVGDLAMWLFGDYVEVTVYNNEEKQSGETTTERIFAPVREKKDYINLWECEDVPKTGWTCVSVSNLGAPVGICVCAGKLQSDTYTICCTIHTVCSESGACAPEKWKVIRKGHGRESVTSKTVRHCGKTL